MKIKNIRFKAKSLVSHNFVEGDLIRENGMTYIMRDKVNLTKIDPSTVCQFTGLKDVKGNEVWEGDILKDKYTGENLIIQWSDYLSGFLAKNKTDSVYSGCELYKSMSWLIVVGNIFDIQPKCS